MFFLAGKKLEDICPSTHNMEVPNVKRKDFQLIGLDDDFLSLMDDNGDTRDDLKCPEDAIGDEIKAAIEKETDILVSLSFYSYLSKKHIFSQVTFTFTKTTLNTQVTCLSACGEECVIATKVNTAVDK